MSTEVADSSPDQSGILARPQNQPYVTARLSHLKAGSEFSFSYVSQPPPGMPWENCEYEDHEVCIADGRGALQAGTVHSKGFELVDAPSVVTNFLDREVIKSTYYEEASEWALAVTGGQRAFIFDHLIRRRAPNRAALNFGREHANGAASTNGRVHNDYTESSGRRRLELVGIDPAEVPLIRRYSIVNIWRSIGGPVLDTPLAVCDARTVMASDLVTSELRYPSRIGQIYLGVHSPLHRWSYFSEMDRHEALVFKQYDSQLSGVARFTPHAAFDHPTIPPLTPLRTSIKVRCLVTYD